MRRRWAALAWVLLVVGCRQGGDPAKPAEQPLVGGLGKRIAAGPVADLKLSKDGAWATFLRSPKRPAVQGVSPKMALGALGLASVKDGTVHVVGQGVSNRPGSVLFSPDGRWLFFVDGFNAAGETGTLRTLPLPPAGEGEVRGRAVSFLAVSPVGDAFAFVDGGVLRVAELKPGSPSRTVATDVSAAQFSPDGKLILVHRRSSAGGALLVATADGSRTPVRLADGVGDWIVSPDGRRVAFTVPSARIKDGRDLSVAVLPEGKVTRVATGTGPFAFSPDGVQLARIEREKAQSIGNLVAGPASGSSGRKVAERVGEFSFAPDGKAVAALANYDENQRWGNLVYAPLPDGPPVELGRKVTTVVWSPDNRHLAFNLRVFKPLPSVDLWVYVRGKPSASRVMPNVYGYDFGPGGALFFRAECTREARSCSLERLDLGVAGAQPQPILEGIFGFRPSEAGNRLLVTYARTDADTYDVAVLNLKSNVRKTLEERILLPALFADPEGSRVVYLVSQGEKSGLYVCYQVP
jgi:dipeptidyl aminopeptidase/acylaminoacyl peptidase